MNQIYYYTKSCLTELKLNNLATIFYIKTHKIKLRITAELLKYNGTILACELYSTP